MKKSIFLIPAIILAFFLVSCEKITVEPDKPIVGHWIGTYTTTIGAPGSDLYYSYYIASDSTVLVQSLGADGNTYYANGRWSLSGNSFTAHITATNLSQTGAMQNVQATYSRPDGTLIGTVQSAHSGAYAATFKLNRVQ